MATISSLGAGSGLDLESLLNQLLAAETQPVANRLNITEANTQASISAFGTFRSALAGFQTASTILKDSSGFENRSASSSNSDIFSASATNGAALSSYSLNVLSLASNHKLASGDFAAPSSVVGSGTLNFTAGDSSFDVTITAGVNDTLDGIKDAINNATGNNNLVSATLLTVDNGLGDGGTVTKLVLTANETGAANQISVAVTDDDGNNFDATGLSLFNAGSTEGVERLAPDGTVFIPTGFNASPPPVVSAITDDPDAPDATFLIANSKDTDTSVRTSFATPAGDLTLGAGLQEIRVAARETAASGTGTPTINIEIYEVGNPTPLYVSATQDVLGSGTQVFSFAFDASILADISGKDIEIVVNGNRSGGNGSQRSAVDIGAVEFNANVQPLDQLTEIQAAQDARITVDGFTAISANNVFDGVIEGVKITALAESEDPVNNPPDTLSIALDSASISNNVTAFIDAYNALRDTLSNLTSFDVENGVSAALNGDFTVRSFEISLRRVLTSQVSGISASLSSIVGVGITTDENGNLELDGAKLNDAITNGLGDVTELFSGSFGIATRVDSLLENYLRSNGLIQTREDGLKEDLDDIEDERITLALRLDSVEQRFRNQFAALDSLVASLNAQGDFLLQQLENTSNIINRKSE